MASFLLEISESSSWLTLTALPSWSVKVSFSLFLRMCFSTCSQTRRCARCSERKRAEEGFDAEGGGEQVKASRLQLVLADVLLHLSPHDRHLQGEQGTPEEEQQRKACILKKTMSRSWPASFSCLSWIFLNCLDRHRTSRDSVAGKDAADLQKAKSIGRRQD